jgi:hypothetical protein
MNDENKDEIKAALRRAEEVVQQLVDEEYWVLAPGTQLRPDLIVYASYRSAPLAAPLPRAPGLPGLSPLFPQRFRYAGGVSVSVSFFSFFPLLLSFLLCHFCDLDSCQTSLFPSPGKTFNKELVSLHITIC